MKILTLHCPCGKQQVFRSRNVDHAIEQMDESGWADELYEPESKAMAHGHGLGECPACLIASQESVNPE